MSSEHGLAEVTRLLSHEVERLIEERDKARINAEQEIAAYYERKYGRRVADAVDKPPAAQDSERGVSAETLEEFRFILEKGMEDGNMVLRVPTRVSGNDAAAILRKLGEQP